MDTVLDERYRATYDVEATRYDQSRFGSVAGDFSARYKNQLIRKILFRHGALERDCRVLDCPAGTGRVTQDLMMGTEIGRVDAVDISNEMLNVGRAKISATDECRVAFHVGNMKELPFADETFDAAIMASFFYLIPEETYQDYISDVYRALKPNGILVVEVSNVMPLNPFTLSKLVKHKYLDGNAIKSYVSVLGLARHFKPFRMVGYRGTEFPVVGSNYDVYRRYSAILGSVIPFRWFAGKFTIVLAK